MHCVAPKTRSRVPVTAKLSRAFYDRVGEQAANELVDWFNAVDATYRSELKEINDLNLAKLEARLSDLKAELIKWMFLFWAGSVVANKLIP